jgi:hypothetical protein
MTYRDEFPDFPEAEMPAAPEGFEDTSWHNDAMPSFEHAGLGLRLHVDYADKAMSESGMGARFGLYQLAPWESEGESGWDWPSSLGDDSTEPLIIETDDWAAVLAAIANAGKAAA